LQTLVVALVVCGSIGGLFAIGWLGNAFSRWNDIRLGEKRRAKLYDEKSAELNSLQEFRKDLDAHRDRLERWQKELAVVVEEKSHGFPWLAQAFADYFQLESLKEADGLRYKKHPARKAAEKVREIAGQRRQVEREMRVARYLLAYYESLFPWLSEFRGDDLDDLVRTKPLSEEDADDAAKDPVRRWLTQAEYDSLTVGERYERALERYWTKKKSPWEIGRDYERYIGYLYERDGWHVYYQGIIEGFADMGRDLVAKQGDRTEIVQCKNWSQEKTIREKHIFQLFGTVTAYRIANKSAVGAVTARFVTSTTLSKEARDFADALAVAYTENYPLQRYPCIKCNVSRRDEQRIYHLPFDQQYDNTIVEQERLECYVASIAEAESLGFRRAFRWKGAAEKAVT
jgi:hypothetical protein